MTVEETHLPAPAAERVPVTLTVNGQQRVLRADPRTSLADALRDGLGLVGTKKGCEQGGCGSCTVLVDGRRVLSCLLLVVQVDGSAVTTVEGLAEAGFAPLQEAFVAFDGLQCGFCTPGHLCSAAGMLQEFAAGAPSAASPDPGPGPDPDTVPPAAEIRERMSGNLCRCGAYNGIVDAVRHVACGGGVR